MDSEIRTPAPIPIAGDTGVHLAYLRRDVDEIKSILKSDLFVARHDFDEHLKTDEDHEERIRGLRDDLIVTNQNVSNIITTSKTWGSAGAAILLGLQAVQMIYYFTHLSK